MSENTGIEWTDATFNPWIGCTRVSPACDHCYAAVSTPARALSIEWGPGQQRHRTSANNWKQPLRWERGYGFFNAGHRRRRRVFCASLADWLDNEVPIEWLVDLLDLIRRTPNLDWLLLTKRIGNWKLRLSAAADYAEDETSDRAEELFQWIDDWANCSLPPTNVWFGATVVNQDEADRDIPKLLQTPARVRFLSCEPLLGPLDLSRIKIPAAHSPPFFGHSLHEFRGFSGCLNWIIAGGESGSGARPMHPDWIRSLRDQCQAAGVPFFFKQWGEWEVHSIENGHFDCCMARNAAHWVFPDGHQQKPSSIREGWEGGEPYAMVRVGKKRAGRLLDGRTWDQFPEVCPA